MDIVKHNSAAWDRYVEGGIEWSIPVDEDAIAGRTTRPTTDVWLTDKTPVPAAVVRRNPRQRRAVPFVRRWTAGLLSSPLPAIT